jgi:serine O-acetyltransferase
MKQDVESRIPEKPARVHSCPPVVLYRVANWFHRRDFRQFARYLSWMNRFLFATWIPGSASIGKGFVVGYWGLGVVIHSRAVIGENVWVSQNVTIGRKEDDEGVPVICDNVFIGPNSVVVGNITLGANCVVGANSFVNHDVPENAIVAGSPARLIKQMKPGEKYKRFEPPAI